MIDERALPASPDQAALDAFFQPRSVAVVGVSSTGSEKIGSRVVRNLVGRGFTGEVYSVGRSLRGAGTLTSAAELPEGVDVAFLAVPAPLVAAAALDCAKAGVKAAVVGSAGFTETGGKEGHTYLSRVRDVVQETGLRVIGPVCSGLYNVSDGVSLGYNATSSRDLRRGGIALFGHSGALMDPIALMIQERGGGLSMFASTGLEVDIDVLDVAEYALHDSGTRVVALILDSVPDASRLRFLAQAAAGFEKRIVVLRVGTSSRGADLAVAHSSRLAGDSRAYGAYFASCGIPVTTTLGGFAAAAALLERHRVSPAGVGALINSGAGGSLLADRASAYGVDLPSLGANTAEEIAENRRFSYAISPPMNPLDLGTVDQSEHSQDRAIRAVASDPAVGVILAVVLTPYKDGGFMRFAETLEGGETADGKPVIVLAPAGLDPSLRDRFGSFGVTIIEDFDDCMQAISALGTEPPRPLRANSDDEPPPEAVDVRAESHAIPLAELQSVAEGSSVLGEMASLQWLAKFGVPIVPMRLCSDESSVRSAARDLGWPVVMKGVVDGVAHKSEKGLVRLDLGTTEAVAEAYASMGCSRVLIQRQVKSDCEAIIGYATKGDVGPLLIAGLGGVFAEEVNDTVMWTVPATVAELRQGLLRTTLGRILTSGRWPSPDSFEQLIEALLGLQSAAIAAGPAISAVEINPFLLGRDGSVAVDGLITFETPALAQSVKETNE